jgi:hypothetical protein
MSEIINRLNGVAVLLAILSGGCAQNNFAYDPMDMSGYDGSVAEPGQIALTSGIPQSGTSTNTLSLVAPDGSINDAACGAVSAEAKQIEVQVPTQVEVEVLEPGPVAIYLMLDQSGSMTETSLPSIKWLVALDAVTSFVNDAASTNVDIALQYFPLLFADCGTGIGYNTPEVAIGRLPDNAKNITNSLGCHIPGIGGTYTPIEGALRGMTDYCIWYKGDKTANPTGEDCVGVIITDGLPTMCNRDANALIDIAARAYTDHKVRTFTIGMMGADFGLLESIAQVGNGDCTPGADPSWTCDVSTGKMTFLDALNAIRGSVTTMKTRTEMQTKLVTKKLDCNWAIPQPPQGETFDKDRVNVQYSATGMPSGLITWGRVDYPIQCGDTKKSWYYDQLSNPSKIVACPKTCEEIKASDKGKINLTFGCKTVLTII